MKEEMKKYFGKFFKVYRERNNSYPRVPWDEDAILTIYEGEVDEEEYIGWKPVEKDIIHSFDDIEEELGVTLHKSIKDYYNSYWFAELVGFYKSYTIILDPVMPGIELRNFARKLIGYKEANEGRLDNIPIGLESRSSLLIVVDNKTGYVKLEDYEIGRYEVISNSIEQLISDLEM